MKDKKDEIIKHDFDFTPESLIKMVGKDKIMEYFELEKKTYKRRGRKRLYSEPTKNKTFVIPISKLEEVQKLVKDYLKPFEEDYTPF